MTASLWTPSSLGSYVTERDERFPTRGDKWIRLASLWRQERPYGCVRNGCTHGPLLPWAESLLRVAGEYVPETGRYRYPLCIVSVPRQTGKTDTAMKYLAARAMTGDIAWYTADSGLKARERFMQFTDYTVPKRLRPRGSLKRGAGSEVWRPPVGDRLGRLRPFPPTRDSLHGEQVDAAALDEGWSHDAMDGAALLTALVPAQQTRRAPQTWILSTAGDAGSDWWDGLVQRGMSGEPGVLLVHYAAPSEEAVFDPDSYTDWHPGAGHLFTPDTVPDMLTQFDSREDAVRSLGNLRRLVTRSKWPAGAWQAACVPPPDPMPPVVALALDVSPDRSHVAVSAAHALEDGRTLVQTLVSASGVGSPWIGDELESWLARTGDVPVAYDTRSATRDVVAELRRRRIRWAPADTPGYIRASSGMFDAVVRGDCVVVTSDALDVAAGVAVGRDVGDTWLWSRGKSPGDITPLTSCSLAWHTATAPLAAVPMIHTRGA